MTDTAGTELLPALRALASLVAVLAAIVVAGWFMRRRLGGGRSGRVRIDERLTISRNQQLLLVRVDSRRLLVGAGEGGFALLAELDSGTEEPGRQAPAVRHVEPPLPRALPAAAARFRSALGHAMRARRSVP